MMRKIFSLLMVFACTYTFGQVSIGGTPPSLEHQVGVETLFTTVTIPIDFDVNALRAEDLAFAAEKKPPRIGKIIPVNFTTENSGEWTTLPNGQDIWRLGIYAENAIAIMLMYDKFEIPVGGRLFIYNVDYSRILGAYTEANNPKKVEYATEFVSGDRIIIEYVPPMKIKSEDDLFETPIIITGVVYGYNNLYSEKTENGIVTKIEFGESEPCMINIVCPEGNDWTDEKRGVLRVVTPTGGSYYSLCSGTVVNNTAGDLDPLFLSADHCYNGLTPGQINQTVYYTNYEHPNCSGRSDPNVPTLVGASILAVMPMNGGSDGCLLRLNENIPPSYNVYYNGWDRRNTGATSGVSIHHPNGDIKKISTYTSSLVSAGELNFGGGVVTAPNSAWRVRWVSTTTGHSVTQGGSSGSPIFNQEKRVVGTLSGGSSKCDNLTGYDYYGKLWYHWDQMSNPSQHMKSFLDPINSGVEYIDGTYTGGMVVCDKQVTNLNVTINNSTQLATLTWTAPPEDQNATITVSANPAAGGNPTGGGTYQIGATATVSANTNSGYNFINWTENGNQVSSNATYTFTVSGNRNLVANFQAQGSNNAQVRFQKEIAYINVLMMAICEVQGTNIISWLAQHEFGASGDGYSPYYEIPAGTWTPIYQHPNGYRFALDNQGTHHFQAGYKYTMVCSDDGEYLVFYLIDDGIFSKSGSIEKSNPILFGNFPKNLIKDPTLMPNMLEKVGLNFNEKNQIIADPYKYNIYLDGIQIATGIENSTYQYTTPIKITESHHWCVKVVCSSGIEGSQVCETTEPHLVEYLPVNPTAEIKKNNALIKWGTPSSSGSDGEDISENNSIPKGISGYTVYRLEEGDSENNWERLSNKVLGYTYLDEDWRSLPSGTYQYAIKVNFKDGSQSEAALSNTVEKSGSKSKELKPENVYLYPNPFKDEIIISCDFSDIGSDYSEVTIQILNAIGQKIKEVKIAEGAIFTGDLPNGVYFVVVETAPGFKVTHKMIKK